MSLIICSFKTAINIIRCHSIFDLEREIPVEERERTRGAQETPSRERSRRTHTLCSNVGGRWRIARSVASTMRGTYHLFSAGNPSPLVGAAFSTVSNFGNLLPKEITDILVGKTRMLKIGLHVFYPSCLKTNVRDWDHPKYEAFYNLAAGLGFENQGMLMYSMFLILQVRSLDGYQLLHQVSWRYIERGATIGLYGRLPVDLYNSECFLTAMQMRNGGSLTPSELFLLHHPECSMNFHFLRNHLPLPGRK